MTTLSESERGDPVDLYNFSMECKSVNTYNIRHPFKLDNDSEKKKTPFVYNEGDSTDGKTFILKHAHKDFGKVDLSSLVTYERCHRLNYYYKDEGEGTKESNQDAQASKANEDDSAIYEDRVRKVEDEKVSKQVSSRSNNDKCVQTSFDKEGDDVDMERNCSDECKRSENYLFPQQINTLSNNNCVTEENNRHNGIDSESAGIENENHDTINNMLASNDNDNENDVGYEDNANVNANNDQHGKREGYADNDSEENVKCNNNDKQNVIKAMEITFNTTNNNKLKSNDVDNNNDNNSGNQLQSQQQGHQQLPYHKPPLLKVKNISNIDLTNNNTNCNAFIDDSEPFANNNAYHPPQPSKLQNLKNHLQQLDLSGNGAGNNDNMSSNNNNTSDHNDNSRSQKQFRSLLEQFKQNLTKDNRPSNPNTNALYTDLCSNFKQHHSPSSPLLKPCSPHDNSIKPPTKSNFDNIKLFSEATSNNPHRPSSNLTEFSIYNPNDNNNNASSNFIGSPRRQPIDDAEINGVKAPSNVRDLKDMFYYNLEANRTKTSLAELNSMIVGAKAKPQMNIATCNRSNVSSTYSSVQHRMASPMRINNTFQPAQPLACKKYNWYIVDSIIYPSNNMHETVLRIDNKLLYN